MRHSPGVKVDTGGVNGSGVLDDLLGVLQLVVGLVTVLVGELLTLGLELLSLGLGLGGSVVNLLADRRSEEGGREEGVGVVSSGSHFERKGTWGCEWCFCVEFRRTWRKKRHQFEVDVMIEYEE